MSQVAKGNAPKVSKLITKGADVNINDERGWTPLHTASQNGHYDIVALLLEKGAHPDKQNNDHETPLHIAALSDKPKIDIMKLLIEKGAKVDSRTETENTPLHYAALKEHIYHIMLLLSEGADVDAQNSKGETAFNYAKNANIRNLLNYHIQEKRMVNNSNCNYDDKKNMHEFKPDEIMVVDPIKLRESDDDDDVHSLDTATTASGSTYCISQEIESNDEGKYQNPATSTRRDGREVKKDDDDGARRLQKCTEHNDLMVGYSSTRIQDIKSKLRSMEYQYGKSYGLYSSTRILEIKSKLRSMEYQYGRSSSL